jgi:hypothetical protein
MGRPPKPRNAPQQLHELYSGRESRRRHYIAEWMERRHIVSQTELADAISADKSLVSRWLDPEKPTTPSKLYVDRLNAFFGGEGDPVDIFRHPDDDWFRQFFKDREMDEIDRMKAMLEAGFPRQARSSKGH